jgi:hypothetical protein
VCVCVCVCGVCLQSSHSSQIPHKRPSPLSRRGMLRRVLLFARREARRSGKAAGRHGRPTLSLFVDSLACLMALLASAHICNSACLVCYASSFFCRDSCCGCGLCRSLPAHGVDGSHPDQVDLASSWSSITCLFFALLSVAQGFSRAMGSLVSSQVRWRMYGCVQVGRTSVAPLFWTPACVSIMPSLIILSLQTQSVKSPMKEGRWTTIGRLMVVLLLAGAVFARDWSAPLASLLPVSLETASPVPFLLGISSRAHLFAALCSTGCHHSLPGDSRCRLDFLRSRSPGRCQ